MTGRLSRLRASRRMRCDNAAVVPLRSIVRAQRGAVAVVRLTARTPSPPAAQRIET